jgi:hypothetical protein
MSGGITPHVYRRGTGWKTMVLAIYSIEYGSVCTEWLRIQFTIYQNAH